MFDFPNTPTPGQVFSPVGGPTYTWNGVAWAANLPPSATAEARSRLVNGAMQIAQQYGYDVGNTNVGAYAADQWACAYSGAVVPLHQCATAVTPNGSAHRTRVGINTADAAVAATDHLYIRQPIEGIRVADFRYGSASAKQSILRFGFKAPAGTYCVSLFNSAADRSYLAPFTISAGQANTDTEQVFIIPGDVTGTWLTNTGVGVYLQITFATGTTYQGVAGWQAGIFFGTAAISNGMASTSNVFELFDVGWYLDPANTGIAPPWQMPDETAELAICERYWQTSFTMFNGNVTTGVPYYAPVALRTIPRATSPSMTGVNQGSGGFPATVGSFTLAAGVVYEMRTATATTAGAAFDSIVIVNSRM